MLVVPHGGRGGGWAVTLVGGGGISAQCPGKLGVQMAEGSGVNVCASLENAGFLCPPFALTPVLTASLGFIQAQLKTPPYTSTCRSLL